MKSGARNTCREENDEPQISWITRIIKDEIFFIAAANALGIGAASFASLFLGYQGIRVSGYQGVRVSRCQDFKVRASKDIAESPTA